MSKYNFELDMKTENSISIIANMVDNNSTVLEFGPDHGRLTKYLKEEKSCTVDIVELDLEAGKEASNFARTALLGEKEGNIENYIWTDRLKDNKYDYIIFADVLEHLYNPDNALSKAKNLLKEGGKVLISIPNICHNSVLINMYNNKFTYTETGLLDNTHIRFWGLNNIEEFAKKVGFEISELLEVRNEVINTEQAKFFDNNWNNIKTLIQGRPYGDVYQFVIVLEKDKGNKYKIGHIDFDNGAADIIKTNELKDGELQAKTEELQRKTKEYNDLKWKEEKMQNQLANYKEHYHAAIQQRDNLQIELQIAKANYDNISNAFFWKMTKPFRAISDLVKKGLYSLKNKGINKTIYRVKTYKDNKGNIIMQGNEGESINEEKQMVQGNTLLKEMIKYKDNNENFYEEYNESIKIESKIDDTKLIAFYLPQYHTFLENDVWWGRGFTEWTNVTKAFPQYEGHYQPQLPIDVGFYDLSNVDVMRRQVELAQKYGVFGFCFHYYWFNGKRLMEKPLNNYLNNKDGLNMPFCLCWANENWTRHWDGLENDVLIAQNHSDEDDIACLKDLNVYFSDERYIKVDGKPMIIIYRADVFPNIKRTIENWRKYYKENGLGELHIVGVKAVSTYNPIELGFDAGLEFPPHHINRETMDISKKIINSEFKGHVYDVSGMLERGEHKKPNSHIYKGVFPSWDNTARRPKLGDIWHVEPNQYKKWLLDVMMVTQKSHNINDRFVFINAWNEWAEGAHLEPDRHYGYAYLQATAEAVIEHNFVEPIISIVAPSYNHEQYIENCLLSIAKQTYKNKELIIIDDLSKDNTVNIIEEVISRQSFKERFINVKFVKHEINKGANYTINEGLNLAMGKFLTVINTDDLYSENRFKEIIPKMVAKDAEIAFSKVETIDENNNHLVTPEVEYFESAAIRIKNSRSISKALIDMNIAVSTGNMVFTKKLFEDLGGFREYSYIYEWDFVLRATLRKEPIFVDTAIYYYRIYSQKTFKELQKDPKDCVRQEKEVLSNFVKQIKEGNFSNVKLKGTVEYIESKYNLKLDIEMENDESLSANTIDDNSTVLEFGPAHGRLTKYLKEEKSCTIMKEYYADSILSLEQANKALLIEKEALLGENLNLIREIDEIKNSRVWRYGTKVAGAIIPYGSKRRKFAGKIINIFKKTNAHKTEAYHETKKANEVENIENPLSTIATSYVDEPCANFHEKVIILTREHCKHIAMAMKGCLENIGIDTQIISDIPKNGYENVYHIVICPQVFPEMPNKYIAFQMEQSISERWFDEDYIEKLHNAEAVFDYSLTNIKYLQEKGIAFEKIYYVPISFYGFYQGKTDVSKKEYDVLFYGDFNCERRKKILKQLGTIHKVKVINDLYGQQLEDEIRKSKIVINIHYYENALLETTRIFQVLSLNTAVVISEESSDMKEREHLRDYVDFVEISDVAKIIERVDYWLSNENRLIEKLENNRRLYESSMENKFEYGFYRYLLAKEIIDFEQFYLLAGDKVILKGDRWCLSIPESYERYNYFEDKNTHGFDCFMGLRHRIGWIGCGLSYKFLLRKAREYKLERVTICEDDVSFGEGFEVRYNKIYSYLSSIEKENWHLYAGLIADLSDDTNVIKVDMFEKEGYVYIDKTVSMVFNIYNSNFFAMLEGWDENDFDLEKNTIDRFIQNSLKIVAITNIPFLVEHEESLRSILWGFGNDCNVGMINNSKAKTLDKVKEYMARSEK